jgi:hypothetical protein
MHYLDRNLKHGLPARVFSLLLFVAVTQACSSEEPTSVASADATLQSLSISTGVLNPAFSTGTTSYSVSVPNSTNAMTVTARSTSSRARVRVNGTLVTNGVPSPSINLAIGSNSIAVVVTAENNTTTRSYTITVARAAPIGASINP